MERPEAPPWLPWALAGLGIAVAVASLLLWVLGGNGTERDREEISVVASDTVLALTNWEADELDAVRQQIADLGTDQLQDEAEGIISDFEEELAAVRAESEGEIVDLAAEVDREHGLVLTIVRQELTITEAGSTTEACWAVRVLLTQEGGEWLADALDLVGPGECPEG